MGLFTSKSDLKKWHVVVIGAMIVSYIILKLYINWWPTKTMKIGKQVLKVMVADTIDHRYKGMSNRKDFEGYDGMLFVFPNRGQHTMVMREMLFPLDIIWIDGDEIVDMAPSLLPENKLTEEEYTPYFARSDSTLVLELPAGFMTKNGLKIGDKVVFSQ